jgi:enamine deaminase RidA (YjgF/YER057c/UK114 family)
VLEVDYPRRVDIGRHPTEWWRDVLAVVRFDPRALAPPLDEIPTAEVNAPVLAGADGAAEIWRLRGPLHSGQRGRLRYRHNGELLFALLSVDEADFIDTPGSDASQALRRATESGYGEIFRALESLGFSHPLRIWNFVPAIHGSCAQGERYWHFNGARQDAFLDFNRSIAGNVPAASALGSPPSSPLTVYCIASARAPIALENPRQHAAWAYPRQYGPRSPTFARACIEDGGAGTLFISGTASIIGHESAHPDDEREQTRETLRNIRALVGAANSRVGANRYSLERLRYKVYVRRPEHQPSIARELRAELGAAASVLYVHADICRRELLVEIEAVGS